MASIVTALRVLCEVRNLSEGTVFTVSTGCFLYEVLAEAEETVEHWRNNTV
jgi:hypothetical protein